MLHLYTIFHCNLAFSSIPKEHYPTVVKNCYWPLLSLCEKGYPIAIEMPAWTLLEVNNIDPKFVKSLSAMWKKGLAEFVGSGYSQAIFPLIPAEVNKWNLAMGNRCYERLLGRRPKLAFVNEQTYSAGLINLYKEAGYEAIVMEWNNCQRYNHYPQEYIYYPQKAVFSSAKGVDEIGLLWNNSIAFQKLQRCLHKQLPEEEYISYVLKNIDHESDRAFPIYGNDAEIFDYRPGDEDFAGAGEYKRLEALFKRILKDRRIKMQLPSEVLKTFKGRPHAFVPIPLESVETPVPCKKQEKYNPVRWAVTGRDDAHINAQCYHAYKKIKDIESLCLADAGTIDAFKEMLCFLWSSDFRTTTTDEKFKGFLYTMGWLQTETDSLLAGRKEKKRNLSSRNAKSVVKVKEDEQTLRIETNSISLELLKKKGLAIKGLVFKDVSPMPLVGTIPHGYYEDIELGADFFSGQLINIQKDGRKITDLSPVAPVVVKEKGMLKVSCKLPLEIGTLWKHYEIDLSEPVFMLTYNLRTSGLTASSLRLGIFTFLPDAFKRDALLLRTLNGGSAIESFKLSGHTVLHDDPVSPAVSASSCLGATEGWVSIGDGVKEVVIETDKARLFSAPMLRYMETGESYFLRLLHSIGEIDDTAFSLWRGHNSISFRISARRT